MTEEPELWAVELLIADQERVAIEHGAHRVLGPDRFIVISPNEFVGRRGSEEWPTSIQIDLSAPSPDAARADALKLYARIRETGELTPDDDPQVLTIGQLVDASTVWDRFSLKADEMLEVRQFELAVIAAQTHCETFIRDAAHRLAKLRDDELAEIATELPFTWSLADRIGKKIFEALFEVEPESAPCWKEYEAHLGRRNRVVHRGAEVTDDLAAASVSVCEQMVDFVRSARNRIESKYEPGWPSKP